MVASTNTLRPGNSIRIWSASTTRADRCAALTSAIEPQLAAATSRHQRLSRRFAAVDPSNSINARLPTNRMTISVADFPEWETRRRGWERRDLAALAASCGERPHHRCPARARSLPSRRQDLAVMGFAVEEAVAAHWPDCRARPLVVHVISTLANSVRRGQNSKNQVHKCDAGT